MVLVVDIGNSNIKLAIFQDDNLIERWKIVTSLEQNVEDYKNIFKHLLNNYKINDVVICSVVPQVTKTVKKSLENFSNNILTVGEKNVKTNLEIDKNIKRDLGQDIVADLVAGKSILNENFIIIDMGTATTINIVGNNGIFLGGVIIPGIDSMVNSLAKCSQLYKFEITEQNDITGSTTKDAMNGGIYWGYIGMLKEIIRKLKEKYNIEDIKVCLTGIRSDILLRHLDFVDKVEKNLTLKGLNEIYKINRK